MASSEFSEESERLSNAEALGVPATNDEIGQLLSSDLGKIFVILALSILLFAIYKTL